MCIRDRYYSEPGEMWVPPEHGRPYSVEEICQLYPSFRERGTPYERGEADECQAPRVDPDCASEIIFPPEQPGSVSRRDIIEIQTAETVGALRGASADQLFAADDREKAASEAGTFSWSSLGKEPFPLREKRETCLLYTSPSPRDRTRSRMPSSA